jgi:hypothetical protein
VLKDPSKAHVPYPGHSTADLSAASRAALNEINGIFKATYSPSDLSEMFHTVSLACFIHRYSRQRMPDLQAKTHDTMVQEAMDRVRQIFLATQDSINPWETRDAIVRATQIYRYQEEVRRLGGTDHQVAKPAVSQPSKPSTVALNPLSKAWKPSVAGAPSPVPAKPLSAARQPGVPI